LDSATVKTKQGLARGVEGRASTVWKGIPFAKKPVGELRFQPPAPPEAWEGTFEATEFGPVCTQNKDIAAMLGAPVENMSEDCLYLNIWAPAGPRKGLPVMVWIHGGAFRAGSGSSPLYDGASLAENGEVIVVTINYRLGAFGFLHLAGLDSSYTANLGLLDQIAALQWVSDNIEAFGGDPEQVTIFGESAGAMSIAALLAMPAAKGLFQKAILESGASQTIPSEQASMIAKAVLQHLAIDGQNMDKLKEIPAEEILKAAERVTGGQELGMIFQPTVDPGTLPVPPVQAIAGGSAAGIPIMIGTNHDEGAFFFRPGTEPMPGPARDEAMVKLIGPEAAERVKEHYPPTIEGQSQFMTDFVFWKPAIEYASQQAKHASVWMYRFDWHIPGHPHVGKAAHGLEIAFVFSNLFYLKRLGVEVDETIQSLARRMQEAWISFAKAGNPNAAGEEINWPAYQPLDRYTYIFDSESRVEADPYKEKRELIAGRN
jgi:para-nitrobenzyl esterase